ncbi:hypothetical protein JYT87_03005 [Nitrospira defluvii]|nr:hypothetical protein [Nitrospira defluvii]
MEKTEKICKKVLHFVSGAIACGIVDLRKKEVLEIHHLSEFSPEQNKATTSVFIELFCSPQQSQLAQIVLDQHDKPSHHLSNTQEVQMSFDQASYFGTTIKNGTAAILLVTKRESHIGTAWAQLRSVIPILEPLIP